MGEILDALKRAEEEKRLRQEDMRLFDTRSIRRATGQAEFAKNNGHGPISARAVEEYNHLKQSILSRMPDMKSRALVFASATPGEGNSNVVANFGIVLASAGERILLVDANLREPVLHTLFGVKNDQGMAELLAGEKTPKQVMQSTYLPTLYLVTAGHLPQNPFPLFASGSIRAILRKMKTDADWILFDAPAVTAFNDAVALGPRTDGVVLVVRAEKTRWEVAQSARERLEEGKANILGVVLNDRKFHIPGWIYRRL